MEQKKCAMCVSLASKLPLQMALEYFYNLKSVKPDLLQLLLRHCTDEERRTNLASLIHDGVCMWVVMG